MTSAELPILSFDGPDAWAAWLEEQHASSKGVWLKLVEEVERARRDGRWEAAYDSQGAAAIHS